MYRPSQRPSFRLRIFPSPFARRFGIKSASFANEQYRNQQRKAIQRRNSYQKVIICPSEPRRLIFDYCGAISALPGAFSLVTAVRFLYGQEAISIDYCGAKYARFTPKIAAVLKALFLAVENSGFADRLRNVHPEKSAVTGICRPSRSPKTAKTPAKVHLRLRFPNLGKPRTAGL